MDMPSRMDRDDRGDEVAGGNERGLLGKLSARISGQRSDSPSANLRTREALLLLQNYEESRRGWFWSTDARGRLTYITDAVARMMGRASNDLLGTPFVDQIGRASCRERVFRSV